MARVCVRALAALVLLAPLAARPGAAPAQEGAAYGLAAAFEDALARDPRIGAAENRIAEARERLEEARGANRPTVTARGDGGYSYNRNEARNLATYKGRSFDLGVTVAQNLYGFGRLAGQLRGAEAEIAEAEAAAIETRQGVLAEVARSFAEQVFRGRIVERRREFEALVAELERTARERIELGMLDRTELHEVLRRLSRARAGRAEAEARYGIARARLARLTGADRPALAAASLAMLEAALPPGPEATLALAARESPALAIARRRVEAAEGDLAFREADLLPALSLEAAASAGRVGDIRTFDLSGGVRLAVPLYEGGAKRSRRRNAELALETARRQLRAESERVEISARTGRDLMEGLALAAESFRAAVADGRTAAELTREKLEAGRVTLVHYIEARQTVLDAEFQRLENRLRLETARIDLLALLAALRPAP